MGDDLAATSFQFGARFYARRAHLGLVESLEFCVGIHKKAVMARCFAWTGQP